MRTLDRYIIKELIPTTLLGFIFYTFIIMMRSLFDFAEMIIKRSLPIGTIGKLLALSLPHIIVLTVPMSLLVGILISIGRLSSDSEITAMRASGIPVSRIFRPVLYFSTAIFVVNLFLMNVVLPRGNTALQDLKGELFTSAVEREVTPRVFYEEFTNWVLYVNDADSATGRWKGVFLADVSRADSEQIIVARSGHLSIVGPDKQIWAEMNEAQAHISSQNRPDRYGVTSNRVQRFRLLGGDGDTGASRIRSFRELDARELLVEARRNRTTNPQDYRTAMVEFHKKFAIPCACLAFAIVGLPLGITNRRGGRSSGFSLSLGIILAYYVMLNSGEDLARGGKIPASLGMWLPNVVIFGFGLHLLKRADHEQLRGGWLAHQFSKLTTLLHLRRRKAKPEENEQGTEDVEASFLSRLDIAFPNLLDRYVLSEFLKVFVLVVFSAIGLFVVVDYSTSIAGEAARNGIPFHVVGEYYRYFVLQVLHYILPVSVLLSTLVAFGMLSRHSEITAMKSHGVSLYRIAVPVVAMAGVVSLTSYLLLDFVLPYANQRVSELKARIKGKEKRAAFDASQQQWIFGKGRYLFNFLSFDQNSQSLSRVQVFEFDESDFRLTRRVYADEARFDGIGWVFVGGWVRSFGRDGSVTFAPIVEPVRLHYPERPDYFAREVKRPEQMPFRELKRYVERLEVSGYDANEMRVKLYEKTSWPFLSVVMALIALPFSFRMGKQGALYGIGIALLLGFAYWIIFGVFTKFGEVGNLPAILSAWAANITFGLAAFYLFLQVET